LSAHAAPVSRRAGAQPLGALARNAVASSWLSVTIAVAIAAVCFGATGGLDLSSATTAEIALTLGSGALVAAAATVDTARRARLWGAGAAVALFAVAAWTALSVAWSVEPSDSWIEASRTLSYAATFAGAIALVRLAPGRWRSLIAGVLLATVVVSGYAVATKILPDLLASGPTLARLNAPFNYWNAVGLTAGLGVPPCLWLGARREGHGALAGLAPPAICLLLVTVLFCYSRGALFALVLGVAFWFVVTPLRLRAASTLAIGAIGAGAVIAWTFAQPALTTDDAPLSARTTAGHELGMVLLLALLICAAAGLVLRFATLRNPPARRTRHRVGVAFLVAVAVVPVAAVLALSVSSRGLIGSISHDWAELTNTTPDVGNSVGRLTALGSERALYWQVAIKAFDASPLLGNGAGSYTTVFLRYAATPATVANAHGYIVQTLADLGLVGLVLSLLLAALWVRGAIRATGPFRRRPGARADESAERIGLLTLITCVVIFTIHSGIDITWFVPGDAMIALLCAGWIVGRGPRSSVIPRGRPRLASLRDSRVAWIAAATVVLTLLVAWSQWQPLRSQDAAGNAVVALSDDDYQLARSDADTAIAENPLDYAPLVWLAFAQAGLHDLSAGEATMDRAVQLQPSNPETWYELAFFEFYELGDPTAALRDLAPALYLDPQSHPYQSLYISLLPAVTPAAPARAPARRRVKHAAGH
jgi:tetratricopeptide (TPR) repeat protein